MKILMKRGKKTLTKPRTKKELLKNLLLKSKNKQNITSNCAKEWLIDQSIFGMELEDNIEIIKQNDIYY